MMENEYATQSGGGGTLTHWNINYVYAYERQDGGLTSSSYPPSSTSLDSTLIDDPTSVIAPAFTEASATTATIISITALPPLNTTLPHDVTKVSYHQHLDVIFLAPLFAVLGILLGVGAASLWWKFRQTGDAGSGICGLGGRKTGGGSRINLEPGPAYAPAPPDEGDGGVDDVEGPGPHSTRNRSMEEVILFAASTPSKTTVHGTRYLFPTHMRDQATSDDTVTKPLCTPFLIGANQFNSAGAGGSDHGDPFTWTHSASSSVYDAERAEAGQSRRSMFQRILNPSISANGRQYAAVRMHDSSPSNHPRLNSIPTLAPNLDPANTVNSTTPYEGRSSAVDVPLRSLEGGAGGEVQRPVRAWLETPEGVAETPRGTRYGDGKSRKYKATGDQHTGYATMTETPRTPISKVSQFWTPRWKNKAVPLLSSSSPAKPSPSIPYIIQTPSQPPRSPSPMPRSAVSTSTREGPSKERKQQDLLEKRMESEPKSLEGGISIPQIDSSVLPRSPPFLMSPPLEAALLFTSTSCGALSFATLANSSPKLVSRSPPTSKAKVFAGTYNSSLSSETKAKANLGSQKDSNANQSAYVTSPDISLFPLPSSAKKLKKRKSQSRSRKGRKKEINRGTETSPMLPFPSYPDQLVQAGQKTSVSTTLASSTSQPMISPTPTMLAILAAAQSLERVNEILVRGYSERAPGGGDMDDEERMLRGGIVVAGIEERSGHGRYL